ncbi:tyrosine-protein phosphatase [Sorangium sp. So ce1036]|uniref:tyrosine-protein phosphatase n=1 Tax=Sorangium sp. So ce1036 TaxID=3133328 RepID=UPI003F0FC46D
MTRFNTPGTDIEPSAPTARLPYPSYLAWFTSLIEGDPDVLALLLLGSVARGDHRGRSDLDVAVLTRCDTAGAFTRRMREATRAKFPRQLAFAEPRKVALFSADALHKIDVFIVEDLSAIARYAAGSRIERPEHAVVFDRTGTAVAWLAQVPPEVDDLDVVVPAQIARFAYHFEHASSCHAMSDMYRARFNLEIALHCVACLEWRASGRTAFAWLPRDLLRVVPRDVAEALRQHDTSMDPSRFHHAKSHVLGMFRSALERLGRPDEDSIGFCELVIERDRFWNHRDTATYTHDALARGVIYRGSSPHRYATDPDYHAWLTRRGITIRIDLRGQHEKGDHPIEGLPVRAVEAPVDPWRELAADDPLCEDVEPLEASYRFTALRCVHALRAVVDAVVEDRGAILVHCSMGVDRTGVIVALAHLLAGVPRGNVLTSYSASSGDKPLAVLERTLTLVDEAGGVHALARRAGLEPAMIEAFRRRMWA